MTYEWRRIWDLDLEKEEYAVIVTRSYKECDDPMSDALNSTWYEPQDAYEITVCKWYTDKYGHKVAGGAYGGYRTGSMDKETANKVYWNLKNRNISLETARAFFKTIHGGHYDLIA